MNVQMGDPSLDRLDLGYRPNPAGVQWFMDRMARGELYQAAPGAMGDGMDGDLMPYLAYYEIEIKNPDGSIWKPIGAEPPYKPQTGNNCTSEGAMHVIDLSEFIAISAGQPEGEPIGTTHRTCVEATYAFGLHKANMRGDQGCYGAAMGKGLTEIGAITYEIAGAPYDEDGSRLRQFANDPGSIVQKFSDKAAPYRMGGMARVTTWEEYCAAIANQKLVTLASDVGFNTPRNEQGICEERGSWNHQMCGAGVIRSDGVETGVILQSWGPGQPHGPNPFKLPTFAFRARRKAIERILAQGDSWAFDKWPGWERRPLPGKWTNAGWGR